MSAATRFMQNTLTGRDLVSIADLSKQEIELILETARLFEKKYPANLLKGSILASCFFEPSTRTRLSCEAAMHRLGGAVIGFSEGSTTSMSKGESLFDAMKVVGSYADLIVIRHPDKGSARIAAQAADSPVLNAGNGSDEHPTQTLIDLFSIRKCQSKIEDLHIALAGDLKYSRTIHSLVLALCQYPVQLYLIASNPLHLPDPITQALKQNGVPFSYHETVEEVIGCIDILYMSRIQKERFEDRTREISSSGLLQKEHLARAKKTLRILHALPRAGEIELEIDKTPFAYYFQQASHAIPVRMALLALFLKKEVFG